MNELACIINDLLDHVFGGYVSIDDLTYKLHADGGHDFSNVSVQTVREATLGIGISDENWHAIRFGCDETLAYYSSARNKEEFGKQRINEYEESLTACACLLAIGLFSEANRKIGIGFEDALAKVLTALAFYANCRHEHLCGFDEFIERLLVFAFQNE